MTPATKLEQIVRDVEQLKPLPASTLRVMRALNDSEISAMRVAELVSLDQALTANVLRLANSAFMGYVTPCVSVHQAVVRVGFERMRSLVLGAAAAQTLRTDLKGYALRSDELWRHALTVAFLARYLAGRLGTVNLEEAYISGLLHDIGKVVLDQYVLDDNAVIAALREQEQLPLWESEKKVLGMDHGAVGGLMTERWHFPVMLIDAVRFHHWPTLANAHHQRLAAIVNLADTYAALPTSAAPEPGLLPAETAAPADGAAVPAETVPPPGGLPRNTPSPESLRILNLAPPQAADLQASLPDLGDMDLSAFDG
jgi:putative nucleotidyltransferase with HDIG domain